MGNLPVPRGQGASDCRLCGSYTTAKSEFPIPATRTKLDIPICEKCSRVQGVIYRLNGSGTAIVTADRESGEVLAEHPVRFTDAYFAELLRAGRLGDWVAGASEGMLVQIWELTQDNHLLIIELQYRIAAEFHRRYGGYRGKWAERAQQRLRRHIDVIRDYAYIWERIGELLTEDAYAMDLGLHAHRHIAAEPDKQLQMTLLDRAIEYRRQGLPQKQIVDKMWGTIPHISGRPGQPPPPPAADEPVIEGEVIPFTPPESPVDTPCHHEYVQRCLHCGETLT